MGIGKFKVATILKPNENKQQQQPLPLKKKLLQAVVEGANSYPGVVGVGPFFSI